MDNFYEVEDKLKDNISFRNKLARAMHLGGRWNGKEAVNWTLDVVFHPAVGSLFSLKGAKEKSKFRDTKTCQAITITVLKRYTPVRLSSV